MRERVDVDRPVDAEFLRHGPRHLGDQDVEVHLRRRPERQSVDHGRIAGNRTDAAQHLFGLGRALRHPRHEHCVAERVHDDVAVLAGDAVHHRRSVHRLAVHAYRVGGQQPTGGVVYLEAGDPGRAAEHEQRPVVEHIDVGRLRVRDERGADIRVEGERLRRPGAQFEGFDLGRGRPGPGRQQGDRG